VAEPALAWTPRSPWDGILPAGRVGLALGPAGVTASPRENLGLATVIARAGKAEALRARLAALHGIEAPARPIVAHGGALDLVWAGPEQWLAIAPDRKIADRLAADLQGLAAITDQSDARAILRLSGPKARDTLAKGCPIDLHPRVFKAGDAALTAIGHVGVHLWQVDDAPTYDLAVPRSMAGSFWRWLCASAQELGLGLPVG
jgi:heterotetrameric sarcosine oxidase gamma subunit